MSQAAMSCPKCQGEMVQGHVLDTTYGGNLLSRWSPGPPKNYFWTGILNTFPKIPIGTFRCQSCGFLESYARKEFAAK